MRYPASVKLEIIRIVEQSHLPARRTLERLGIPRSTFHRWYDRFLTGGVDALEDRSPRPGRVWNRIPQDVRDRIVELALEMPELSPRELAVTFTDTQSYFVSEASVYRLLKAHDLITSPAFIVIKAAAEFRDKTTAAAWRGIREERSGAQASSARYTIKPFWQRVPLRSLRGCFRTSLPACGHQPVRDGASS